MEPQFRVICRVPNLPNSLLLPPDCAWVIVLLQNHNYDIPIEETAHIDVAELKRKTSMWVIGSEGKGIAFSVEYNQQHNSIALGPGIRFGQDHHYWSGDDDVRENLVFQPSQEL